MWTGYKKGNVLSSTGLNIYASKKDNFERFHFNGQG